MLLLTLLNSHSINLDLFHYFLIHLYNLLTNYFPQNSTKDTPLQSILSKTNFYKMDMFFIYLTIIQYTYNEKCENKA